MENLFTALVWTAGIIAIPYVFWVLAVICFFLVAINIDDSRNGDGWGLATLGSAGLIYLAGSYFGITFDMIKAMPSILVYGAIGYAVTGVIWSFAKWYFKLTNIRDTYLEAKAKFIQDNKITGDFPVKLKTVEECVSEDERQALNDARKTLSDFYSLIKNGTPLRNYNVPKVDEAYKDPNVIAQMVKPLATEHKSSITQWIAFWPISFTWTIINDPVRKAANYIFSRIKSVYARMSDKIFAGM